MRNNPPVTLADPDTSHCLENLTVEKPFPVLVIKILWVCCKALRKYDKHGNNLRKQPITQGRYPVQKFPGSIYPQRHL